MSDILKDITPLSIRKHVDSPQHNLDRVKLSCQIGPLGSFDRPVGEAIIHACNNYPALETALRNFVDYFDFRGFETEELENIHIHAEDLLAKLDKQS